MSLNAKQINSKLKKLGLVEENDSPILYSKFKNRASIHRYGRGKRVLKIIFLGLPKENMFGFYPAFANDTDVNVMKEAYAMYLRLLKGDLEDFNNGSVQWGDKGIPLAYGNLRNSLK